MNIFPTTSINNFFKEPDKIVEYAKKLKYKKSKTGSYPGERTENLSKINYELFNSTIYSILSMYYEDLESIGYSDTYLGFHKIKPYSKSLKDIKNKGWIHHDGVALGGLIYLNKKRPALAGLDE